MCILSNMACSDYLRLPNAVKPPGLQHPPCAPPPQLQKHNTRTAFIFSLCAMLFEHSTQPQKHQSELRYMLLLEDWDSPCSALTKIVTAFIFIFSQCATPVRTQPAVHTAGRQAHCSQRTAGRHEPLPPPRLVSTPEANQNRTGGANQQEDYITQVCTRIHLARC